VFKHYFTFSIGQDLAGYMFACGTLTYMIAGLICGYTMTKMRLGRKLFILCGLVSAGISNVFLGPDPLIEKWLIDTQIWTIICCMIIIGAGLALATIPIMPEFIYFI